MKLQPRGLDVRLRYRKLLVHGAMSHWLDEAGRQLRDASCATGECAGHVDTVSRYRSITFLVSMRTSMPCIYKCLD